MGEAGDLRIEARVALLSTLRYCDDNLHRIVSAKINPAKEVRSYKLRTACCSEYENICIF